MTSRSKQVMFLLMLAVAFFVTAGLTLWHVNERYTAEKTLETLQTKWDTMYGDGRYEALKEELTTCTDEYNDVLAEIEQLQTKQQTDEALIATHQQTVLNILNEINGVLEQNGYGELTEQFTDLKQRFESLNRRYEALKQ